MATKYAEFPVEETDKFIYGGAPAQVQTPEPAQVQAQPAGPVAPPAPVAKAPNASGLVNKVAEANKQLQEQMPAPQPQSAASNLVGDITKNWESYLPLAAIPPIAWLAYKAMGGGDGKPPNTPPNDPPNNPPKSIADRTIRKIEPLMDVNQAPTTGRIEPEFGKPTTESVVKRTPKDPIEKMLLERYEAQQAAKAQPPTLETSTKEGIKPTDETKTDAGPSKKPIVPTEEKLTKGQEAMKKHLVSLYGNGPEALSAYNQVRDILGYTPEFPPGKGGSLNPEEKEKILQYRKENIAGPKINLTHEMKKAMKAGGGAAALMAIPGFANASTFKEAMGNIGEALLPMGMTPSELAPGTLTEKQLEAYKEAQKLGSPYRSVPPR